MYILIDYQNKQNGKMNKVNKSWENYRKLQEIVDCILSVMADYIIVTAFCRLILAKQRNPL